MIDRIVHEIRMALSHELYLSALALALTLPDTCGKAEYPNEDYNGVRYKNWCSQYVITDRCDSPYGYDRPYLNEEIIYSLRNCLLHQSTPNVEQSRIHESRCKVSRFDSRLIALDTKLPRYFTALCRVASRCCPFQSHI